MHRLPKKAFCRCLEKGARVIYLASMKNHRCSGEYLRLALERMDIRGAAEVLILVCDTLQVHNVKTSEVPTAEDYETARRMGDAWLERNKEIIDTVNKQFKLRVSVMRFDDVTFSQPDHAAMVECMRELIDRDDEFNQAMTATVHELCRRKDASTLDMQKVFDFLLEELPIIYRAVTADFFGFQADTIAYAGSAPAIGKCIIDRHGQNGKRPFRWSVIEFTLSNAVSAN